VTKGSKVKRGSSKVRADKPETPVRERVLTAAFAAFREHGVSGTSTLEIATRAKASKRELYALFANKHAMLAECIAERTRRMRLPLELPAPTDRAALAATLAAFGTAILRGVSDPSVLAVYRLAIAESKRSPQVARALDKAGRETNHAALAELLTKAKARGLLPDGDPNAMAAHFFGLLWGSLLIRLLLCVTEAPAGEDIGRRASEAAAALLTLYPDPGRGRRDGSKSDG
jgi:AcrR family transcriptional regulator